MPQFATAGNFASGALTATPTPNNPPTIVGLPDPQFTDGVASEYDIDQHMTDLDGDSLTAIIAVALPSGVTLRANPGDNALVYDGIGSPVTSASHTLTADDVKSQSSPSATFDIIINAVATADYTIKKIGGDYTSIAAWLVDVGLGTVAANTITELQAPNVGGEETWIEQIIPDNGIAGGDGTEYELRGRVTDNHRVYSLGGNPKIGSFELDNVSYFKLRNVTLGDADNSWFQGSPPTDAGRSITSDGNIHFYGNSHHIDIIDCLIYGGSSLGNSHLNRIAQGCHTIRFLRSPFTLGGSNNDTQQSPDAERGDLIRCRGHNVIFDGGSDAEGIGGFSLGGHDGFIIHGYQAVFRNLLCSGDWTAAPESTGFAGSRCGSFEMMRDDQTSTPAQYGPGMIENCIMRDSGDSADQDQQSCHKLTCDNPIIRGNYYFDNDADIWSISPNNDAGQNSVQHSQVYNNTCINNGVMLRVRDSTTQTTNNLGHAFFNNICIRMTGEMKTGDQSDAQDTLSHVFWDCTSIAQQGTPDNWIGATFGTNRLHATSEAINIFLRGPQTHDTVAGAESGYPLVWTGGNVEGLDGNGFVNESARTKAGCKLAAGNADIQNGQPHTHAAANSSGTVVTVDSARPFYDAWGTLDYFGEVGDYIKIVPTGMDPRLNGVEAQIAVGGVDRGAGTLTLTSSPSVTNGDDIWWVQTLPDGTRLVADNLGANQDNS